MLRRPYRAGTWGFCRLRARGEISVRSNEFELEAFSNRLSSALERVQRHGGVSGIEEALQGGADWRIWRARTFLRAWVRTVSSFGEAPVISLGWSAAEPQDTDPSEY